jgi:hypothetical protein
MKLILHIGMSKCGSSSLQNYLSSSEFYEIAKLNRIGYAAIDRNGDLLQGSPLIKKASESNFGYITSCSGTDISAFDKTTKKKLLRNIASLKIDYDTLILSNEGWGSNPSHFLSGVFLSHKDLKVTILGFVRPQIEWLNSAWWQWGAWTAAPFRRWINSNKSKAKWFELLSEWKKKEWVENVQIKLLTPDIVTDLHTFLGLNPESSRGQKKINKGLPEPILRLYQRNRHLRPGPHASEIDFILSKHIFFDNHITPWIMPPHFSGALIQYFRDDNENLLSILSSDEQKQMKLDDLWWSTEPYLARAIRPLMARNLKADVLESILVKALEAIVKLNNELKTKKI